MPIEYQRNNFIYFSRQWNRLHLQIIWIHMVAFLKSKNGLSISIYGSRVRVTSAVQRKQEELTALGRRDFRLFVRIMQITAIQTGQLPDSWMYKRVSKHNRKGGVWILFYGKKILVLWLANQFLSLCAIAFAAFGRLLVKYCVFSYKYCRSLPAKYVSKTFDHNFQWWDLLGK